MNLFRTPSSERGQAAENQACQYLMDQGLQLVSRNYRCRHGEIDLIMRDDRGLVFIEVRYRSHSGFASAAESIDRRKRDKLVATALHYLQAHPASRAQPARFDVIAITPKQGKEGIQWISNAFGVEC